MFDKARIFGFAAIALAAFGTATGIAAISRSDDIAQPRYADLVYATPKAVASVAAGAGCAVDLVDGSIAAPGLALTIAKGETVDLDTADSGGFSIACGGNAAAPALTPAVAALD